MKFIVSLNDIEKRTAKFFDEMHYIICGWFQIMIWRRKRTCCCFDDVRIGASISSNLGIEPGLSPRSRFDESLVIFRFMRINSMQFWNVTYHKRAQTNQTLYLTWIRTNINTKEQFNTWLLHLGFLTLIFFYKCYQKNMTNG